LLNGVVHIEKFIIYSIDNYFIHLTYFFPPSQ
jgi:hypothetical protein